MTLSFPVFAQSRDEPAELVLGNLNLSLDTNVLEDGSETKFSLGYRYTPSIEGGLRISYVQMSYNDTLYDLQDSLVAYDELMLEIFLLPFRYHFFNDSILSFNVAAGAYYEYNTVKQHGYFNMPALAPDSLNTYRNDFSMHVLGPLAETGLRIRLNLMNITLNLGIVPIFYLRRDQSLQMNPYMGPDYFDHSQNTSGSPYVFGELNGVFFRFLSLSLLYNYFKIDYDVISINATTRNWMTPGEELVSKIFKVEASVLLPLGGGFSFQVGYGYSFDTIEIDSGTPVHENNHYFIIGTKKDKSR
jgi:hypothetical protein